MTLPTRPGRRPGESRTRDRILAEARELFGDKGFAGTTLRAVAAAARVDVALIGHYFGNKDGLFAAALEVPIDRVVGAVLNSPTTDESLGCRVVRAYLTLWDHPDSAAQMRATLRCASAHPEAAVVLRTGLANSLAAHVPAGVVPEPRELRINLIGSQLIGLGLTRSIVGLPRLNEVSVDDLVRAVGPTIQRYLDGDLGLTGHPCRPAHETTTAASAGPPLGREPARRRTSAPSER